MLQRHRGGTSNGNLRNLPPRQHVSADRNSGRNSSNRIRGVLRRYGGGSRRLGPWATVFSAAGCCCGLWFMLSWFSLRFPNSGGEEGARSESAASVDARDYQGTSRTTTLNDEDKATKPRIAIISNAVAFPYGEATTAHWSLFKEYFANKDCYANTHGYDLIIDSRYCCIRKSRRFLLINYWCDSLVCGETQNCCRVQPRIMINVQQ